MISFIRNFILGKMVFFGKYFLEAKKFYEN